MSFSYRIKIKIIGLRFKTLWIFAGHMRFADCRRWRSRLPALSDYNLFTLFKLSLSSATVFFKMHEASFIAYRFNFDKKIVLICLFVPNLNSLWYQQFRHIWKKRQLPRATYCHSLVLIDGHIEKKQQRRTILYLKIFYSTGITGNFLYWSDKKSPFYGLFRKRGWNLILMVLIGACFFNNEQSYRNGSNTTQKKCKIHNSPHFLYHTANLIFFQEIIRNFNIFFTWQKNVFCVHCGNTIN